MVQLIWQVDLTRCLHCNLCVELTRAEAAPACKASTRLLSVCVHMHQDTDASLRNMSNTAFTPAKIWSGSLHHQNVAFAMAIRIPVESAMVLMVLG